MGSHYYPIHRLKDFNKSNLSTNNLNFQLYNLCYSRMQKDRLQIKQKTNRKLKKTQI